MIKNSVLAVVIPTVLAAGAAAATETHGKVDSALDMYGEASGVYHLSRPQVGERLNILDLDDKDGGDKSYVRFGLEGKTPLKFGLTAYSKIEHDILTGSERSHHDGLYKTCLAFAGLRSDKLGSIDYGRNFGVIHDATSWTTSVTRFGGDASYSKNFLASRANGVVTYRNANLFGTMEGLEFAIQYQPKSAGDNENDRYGHGDTWGMSTSYISDAGIGIVGSYSQGDLTDAQRDVEWGGSKEVKADAKASQWATSMKYDANQMYLAATYGETYNATYIESRAHSDFLKTYNHGKWFIDSEGSGSPEKVKNLQIVAQYKFDLGLTPSISYVESYTSGLTGQKDKDAIDAEIDQINAHRKSQGKDDCDHDQKEDIANRIGPHSFSRNLYLEKYYELGLTYDITDNISTFINYKINQQDLHQYNFNVGDVDVEDCGEGSLFEVPINNIIAVGLTYQF
jgi:outer membrane pore protein F